MLDTSSDEEEPLREHAGSLLGKAANVKRGHQKLSDLPHLQYFATDPIYNHKILRRRFPVSRAIFDRLFEAAKSSDDFVQQRDCTCELRLSKFKNVTAAMRIMAYDTAAYDVDEEIGL